MSKANRLWLAFASVFVIFAMLATVANAKGSRSSSSRSSSSSSSSSNRSSGSSTRPSTQSRPSQSRPVSGTQYSGDNSRPKVRKVVVKRAPRNAQNNRLLRPRGKYRTTVIGGRTYLRQGNRLYNTRRVNGRTYLVYYGNVQPHKKSHAWLIWLVVGIGVLAIIGLLAYLALRRRN